MVTTLQARNVGLAVLRRSFGLEWNRDPNFFPEWQQDLPNLSKREQAFLDNVREGYFSQLQGDGEVLEKIVQLTVVSPLLCIAGLYIAPFEIRAEQSIELETEDDGVIIKGTLDILIIQQNVWVMVIESKKAEYSIEAGLSQLLAYLLAHPNQSGICYGLLASGSDFIFIKLVRNEQGVSYGTSDQFAMRRSGDLYQVFRILKRLTQGT